jgi:glutamate synthase (NADPH/NADH) large chain
MSSGAWSAPGAPARLAATRLRDPRLEAGLRWEEGHDGCGLIVNVRKFGKPSHGNVKRTLEALHGMAHRTGDVSGEGDGCGIHTDIPRLLWSRRLAAIGLPGQLAYRRDFFVGHAFNPAGAPVPPIAGVRALAEELGIRILIFEPGTVQAWALGPAASVDPPAFIQFAGVFLESPAPLGRVMDRAQYRLELALESEHGLHVCSLSRTSCVYKVRGTAETLERYYPELRHPEFQSVISIGHNRFSTNTLPRFEQVQPFGRLAHNGEINTIERLRREALRLGVPLIPGASDSQDLDRTLHALLVEEDLTLVEAMAHLHPPIVNEMKRYPAGLAEFYVETRQAWGPFAQGPAALVVRWYDEVHASLDALGLRPLWIGETEKEAFCTSERGVLPLGIMLSDPRPLAPGEQVLIRVHREAGLEVLTHDAVQEEALRLAAARRGVFPGAAARLESPGLPEAPLREPPPVEPGWPEQLWGALGFSRADLESVRAMAASGKEQIGSLGHDGPLAALSRSVRNTSDFLKESVAVVTNPAIDREREIEHFSTRTILGRRHRPGRRGEPVPPAIELASPLLGGPGGAPDWLTLDSLLAAWPGRLGVVESVIRDDESLAEALERVAGSCVEMVEDGHDLLVLSDAGAARGAGLPLDPLPLLAWVHHALDSSGVERDGEALRRRTGLVLSSGALRNLHDVACAIGFGADAVHPSALVELAHRHDPAAGADRLLEALRQGLEKVISTMGIHELRGYGRIFGAIGLAPDLARRLGVPNFAGSERAGLTLEALGAEWRARWKAAAEGAKVDTHEFRVYPRVWKAAGATALGAAPFAEYWERCRALERDHPTALRHTLEVSAAGPPLDPNGVDVAVRGYALPLVISGMSFGSQGPTAFKAYVEAAARLGMVAMNGEGGEMPELLGRFDRHRGQQVASGRFGVNARMLNSAAFIEIKVGQGAKPGEGGHLPGSKVSAKVAEARRATPGVDLISPSNNHDIYSIEDLAQLVEELRTCNPGARISVKVPAVPGLGTIGLGIAKAGADVITISGYEGGTGAARQHALRHAGMPAEIGVAVVHRALVEAGLRGRVEIWADGGVRTPDDVLRLMCLGANRCGFGTLAMVAIGCTICRLCQTDTCHVGIATQIESVEDAVARGLKTFSPRHHDHAVEALVRFFGGFGAGLREAAAARGVTRLQELVGRVDLLVQERESDRVDLADLLTPPAGPPRQDPGGRRGRVVLRRPLNYLTRMVATMVEEAAVEGVDEVTFNEERVGSTDRALGTYLSGRRAAQGQPLELKRTVLHFDAGSIPGNGLAAFNTDNVEVIVEGGAQDGVGKGASGGRVAILKGVNHQGRLTDGSVGKGLGYGAQGGQFLVQGDADSRCGIRLSGADMVIAGEPETPRDDARGNMASRANIKGFAFEYMTAGRAVVLGDPGPWICSGMTGGVVYLRLLPQLGLDRAALVRRIAKGAKVRLREAEPADQHNLAALLGAYADQLDRSGQGDEATRIRGIAARWASEFLVVVPASQLVDQSVSTE